MPEDKRRFPRLQSMNIVAEKGRVFRTLDLSREGMLLEMDVPAAIGTRLHLDLAMGDDVVDVAGEVMRHVPQDNGRVAVGIRFSRMAPRSERMLREYLLKKQK
jgi:c-di-GMP-binding flagellar brake protein YcgR